MSPLVLLLSALAQAAATPPPAPPPTPEVVVVGSREPPRVARTFPKAGDTPAFGVLVLTVAFDQPMLATSAPAVSGEGAPECRPTWRLLKDGKTFVVLCALKAGEAAHLRLAGFRDVAGRPAAPVELAFAGDADKVDASLEDAMRSAGLKPEEGPVMDWATPPPAPAKGG